MLKAFPLWVSHSSIGDYLSCPKLYYYRQIYKDPKTGKKINIINPSLALGNVVHEVLESLSILPVEKRFEKPLLPIFEDLWKKFSGASGGFKDKKEEEMFKKRGERMIKNVSENPSPLANKALRLLSPDDLPPRFLLSGEENIILCGKIDWLEYMEKTNSVHIIDFKTGANDEKEDSLQLPIYALLVKNCQKRNIEKISYWYLDREKMPREMSLPDFELAKERVLSLAIQIKKLRKEGEYVCKRITGCFACTPFENIVKGNATFIRTSGYQDIYANM